MSWEIPHKLMSMHGIMLFLILAPLDYAPGCKMGWAGPQERHTDDDTNSFYPVILSRILFLFFVICFEQISINNTIMIIGWRMKLTFLHITVKYSCYATHLYLLRHMHACLKSLLSNTTL